VPKSREDSWGLVSNSKTSTLHVDYRVGCGLMDGGRGKSAVRYFRSEKDAIPKVGGRHQSIENYPIVLGNDATGSRFGRIVGFPTSVVDLGEGWGGVQSVSMV